MPLCLQPPLALPLLLLFLPRHAPQPLAPLLLLLLFLPRHALQSLALL